MTCVKNNAIILNSNTDKKIQGGILGINPRAIAVLAEEFEAGRRQLVLHGSDTMEEGFYLHPARHQDVEFMLTPRSVSRKITVQEALELAENPHCKNKEAIIEFLIAIKAI